MFRKGTIMLITVLSCLALICVGFSSWATMTGDLNAQTTGGISSESVIYSDEYVKIDKEAMDARNKDSFVVTPEKFSSGKDSLIVPFSIDADKCKAFAGGNSLTFRVTLSFADNAAPTGFFAKDNITFSVAGVNGTVQDPSTSSFVVEITLDLGSETGTITREGTFKFNLTNEVYKAMQTPPAISATRLRLLWPFQTAIKEKP